MLDIVSKPDLSVAELRGGGLVYQGKKISAVVPAHNDKRRGYAQAIRAGFRQAEGDIIVTIDADGEHYYNPDHRHLLDLGYKPTHDVEQELRIILKDLSKYRSRIEDKKGSLNPGHQVGWYTKKIKVVNRDKSIIKSQHL